MSRITDSTVLITGGASGLGKSLARLFLRWGASRLIIWDSNRTDLDSALTRFQGRGHQAAGQVLDISDPDQVRHCASKLSKSGITVDILVNNAGTAAKGWFASHDHDTITTILQTNAAGPMHCTLAWLPGMIEKGQGHIVNISSAAALLPIPGLAVYSASKCALSGWSMALARELDLARTGVRVTLVNPGYMDTAMFQKVRKPVWMPCMNPDQVASRIVKAVRKNRTTLTMPVLVRLGALAGSLIPSRIFEFITGRVMGLDRFIPGPGGKNDPS
ncbi:SDR family NAD(P)-dependent oxidoreductase [Desulfonatronovibrio hydrogenovorans]|uniref:SDR family NAD(P)-dependent oxidoreductase n=1 Tax=Desulfonatronovibrio hydrogenovorans TaxID=53245 RepID=UPI00048F00D7|nr:SDR family NAD(P)-dependent oxidoreductase [Desulfonatronovibrio hydrogenovorans]